MRRLNATLHYTPSALTRGLHRRASTTLGVCLPHPLEADVAFGNSFFGQLWRGIMFQADVENYSLLHYPGSVRNGESCDPFLDGRVDGMLLHEHDNRHGPRVMAAGMPTVLLNRSLALPGGCGTVFANDPQTAAQAAPPLTSVEVPVDEIGREAVRTLLRLLHGSPSTPARVAVPVTQIVLRQSTAPLH